MQKYVDMFTVVSSRNNVWPSFDLGNYLSNEKITGNTHVEQQEQQVILAFLQGQNKSHVALHCCFCSEVWSLFF